MNEMQMAEGQETPQQVNHDDAAPALAMEHR